MLFFGKSERKEEKSPCKVGELFACTHKTAGSCERLKDTARKLFFQKGYAAVSVEDICKAANAQKGSFYHFFPTKEALLLAVMETDHQEWSKELEGIFSPANAPPVRISLLIESINKKQNAMKNETGMVVGIPYTTLGCESAPNANTVCQKSNAMANTIENHIAQTVKDAQKLALIDKKKDATATARQLCACIAGVLTYARIQNNIENLQTDLAALFSSYFGGAILPNVSQT